MRSSESPAIVAKRAREDELQWILDAARGLLDAGVLLSGVIRQLEQQVVDALKGCESLEHDQI